MADKKDVSGITEDQLKQTGKDNLAAALGEKAKAQKGNDETGKQNDPKGTETSKTEGSKSDGQDAKSDLSKYDNILLNTFGFEEGEITEKDRKIAKSWSEIQSTATKAKQSASELQQYKKVVDQMNATLEKYPTLYEKLQQAAQGQYQENPTNMGADSGQPKTNTGQLDDVSEETLVAEGYLSQDDLQGLDDLAKQRKILRAEAKYIREKEAENFRNSLQSEQDNLRKQQEQQRLSQENKRRLDEGFDNFVSKYGVNFAELDDQVLKQINKRIQVTLDPEDPRLIADDAFEIVASNVLSRQGLMPENQVQTSGKTISKIEDTGKSFSKANNSQSKSLSVDQQLKKTAWQKFSRGNDPKAQFKQKVS